MMRRFSIFVLFLAMTACGPDNTCDTSDPNCINLPPAQLKAIDGDTYEMTGIRIRLAGWDSPETGGAARCKHEHELGLRAEAQAKLFVRTAKRIRVQRLGHDQYERAVAHIWLNGTDVGELLEADGLAQRIHKDEVSGKADWCGRTS